MRRRPTIAVIALISVTLLAALGLFAAGRRGSDGPVVTGAPRATAVAVTGTDVAQPAVTGAPAAPGSPTLRAASTRKHPHTQPLTPVPGFSRIQLVPGLTANQATNIWSGYATPPNGSVVTDVVGTWVVPTVTGGIANTWNACSDWIGIDGYGNNSVEQVGTEEDYGNPYNNVTSYSAWWEMFDTKSQSPEQTISMAISPGDVMTAEVRSVGSNTFVLSITDVTRGTTFTTTQTALVNAQLATAEWIHEAPTAGTVLPLTPTTPAVFSNCKATINGVTGPIASSQWQPVAINMYANQITQGFQTLFTGLLASPSVLTSNGMGFTVTDSSTPPTTTLSATPAPNSAGWNRTTVSANMTATDLPGGWTIASTKYRLNGGANLTYTNPVAISTQGTDTLAYWSTDVAGNVEASRVATFRIDTTPPHTTSSAVASYTGPAVISLTATDTYSGVAATYYRLDGAATTTYSVPVTVAPPANGSAPHAMSFWSTDRAGNVEASTTANFTVYSLVSRYTLSYAAGAGGSIVGSATQVVVAGASGTTVTATPTTGYGFVSWSDGKLTAARVDTAAANLSVTSNFAINTYTLAPSAGAHGTISPATTQTVNWGSTTTFTITADPGYHVADVLVDGGSVGAVTSYTFANVTADHTISASFAANSTTVYTLSYAAGSSGSVVGSATQVVPSGASGTTVTAAPNVGYHFVTWSDGVLTAARVDRNVKANVSVTASFLRVTSLSITSNRTYALRGQTVTFSGAMSPSVPNTTRIIVEIRKTGSNTWTTLSIRLTSSSHWSYAYKIPKTRAHGTYYVRARYAGSATLLSCGSASRKLVIN